MIAILLAVGAALAAAAAVLDIAGSERPVRSPTERPRRLVAAIAAIGARSGLRVPIARDLPTRLAAAGAPSRIRPADVVAVKAGGVLMAPLLVLPLAGGAPPRLSVLLLTAAPLVAFLAPDVWLARRARARAQAMAADVPDVLDLLRVALAAGLPLGAALQAVSARRGGLLAQELGRAAIAMELGAGRAAALAELGARCPLPGVLGLIAAARRSDKHGTPLAPALAAMATDARHERARRRKEHADRAAPKIQLAVALLLVPAAMLLLAAGMVAGFT